MLIILAIVFFILWKKTTVLDFLKKNKETPEQLAEKKAAEKEAKEQARLEKIANCTHNYETLIYDGYKDDLFVEIDEEGHELKKCPICGDIIKGDIVAKVNCSPIPETETDEIVYAFKGKYLVAGDATAVIEDIHYLLANKNWVNLDIEKGEVFVAFDVRRVEISKNDDYPVGAELKKVLKFKDEEGNFISEGSLSTAELNLLNEYDLAKERYGRNMFDLSYEQREEVIRDAVRSHSVLLRVPNCDSRLSLAVYFPELLETEE